MTGFNPGCSEHRAAVAECVSSWCCCVLGVLVFDPGLCCTLRCRMSRFPWQILEVCTHCLYHTILYTTRVCVLLLAQQYDRSAVGLNPPNPPNPPNVS